MEPRRAQLASEASSIGTSTSCFRADLADNLRLLDLLDNDITAEEGAEETLTPEQQLGRLLSMRSVISTTSSFTEQQQAAVGTQGKYRLIEWGACGAVYARDGATFVLKLAKSDDHQLWNDYVTNTKVWEAIASLPEISDEVHVPQPNFYVPGSQGTWWAKQMELFSADDIAVNLPTAALCTERIFPLPSEIRLKLIQKFCSPRNQAKAIASPGNRDCLVRVYLGSTQGKIGGMFFSLRNFKLYLNQMLELVMLTLQFASYMAGTLAAIHWSAQVDARDIEFVLGSAPATPVVKHLTSAELEETEPDTYTGSKVLRKTIFTRRKAHLWVLDFNQCRKIPMSSEGVRQAVDAFFLNDPYYPRPPQDESDQHGSELWNVFACRYIQISDHIFRGTPELRSLPRQFVRLVMDRQQERMNKRSEDAVASASGL